jgi:hypothetical protein
MLFAAMFCASLLFSCTEVERDNPYDEKSKNYQGGNQSSSSTISSSSSYLESNAETGACYVYYEGGYEEDYLEWGGWGECIEPIAHSVCDYLKEEAVYEVVRFLDSCPPGYKYSCPTSAGRNIYYYGDIDVDDCDDLR